MRARRVKKRTWLILAAALLAAELLRSNLLLQTEEFSYVSSRLPAAFDGYRIAVVSDLHGATFGAGNADLLTAIAAAEPDIIAVTGDLEDRFRGHDAGWLDTLAAGLAGIAPVYCVTGNHEWAIGGVRELKKTLAAAGWTVLSNQFVTLERGGDTLVLAGIDDPNGFADQKTPEQLTVELYAEHGDPFWLLLAHRNNRFAEQYSLLGADLTISGHGHGGIIRLPFTDGLFSVERTLFPSDTAGFYQRNGQTQFVSRGLGNSGPSLRMWNRPQLAVVTLRCG